MGKIFVIGITGGIGAGKSTILTYLKQKYDASIIVADVVAKQLMEPGGETYQEIIDQFGEDLKGPGERIDKVLLAKRIFEQGLGTDRINEMVHPAVLRKTKDIIEQQRMEAYVSGDDDTRIVVLEAALLFEAHADALCDEVWYVYADSEIRIARLIEERRYSREKCLAIMDKQLDEEKFREKSGVVIDNSAEPEDAYAQIDERIRTLGLA